MFAAKQANSNRCFFYKFTPLVTATPRQRRWVVKMPLVAMGQVRTYIAASNGQIMPLVDTGPQASERTVTGTLEK